MTLTALDPVVPLHELRQVAEGVHAYLQPDGGWCLNNAGIVLDGNGPVLVDTAATEARARKLRGVVRELSAKPVSILVNTHSHGDHTFGNHLFGEATVVAHRRAAEEMADHGLSLTSLWPDTDWGHVEAGFPRVVFDDRMTLPTSTSPVEVLHFGPGHTAGDAVVWLPGQRVLFTGDLVFSGATPFVLMGSVAGSLRVLDRLRSLDPLVVVPGHGPVGGPELLEANAEYLRWVARLARGGIAEGLTPLQLARATDLGPHAELLDSERLVGNLARAYAEQRGARLAAPLDVPAVFGEMVDYRGSHPHCAA
ncbi:MBL fold metallo-hydrolase [Streptomyces sp. NBC_01218]|uniref:MBL fold metallo-hydrolase n=1 Tax=Streptomyces sp. NBC_01218 TaxID=2903780 RepID=UPI002E13975D|nr:MBL fold metallo-hydrolase [Streptomyces sp. NBC_01218]